MAISLADKLADFKEQYLVSETELYSSNPQRELELTALLGRLGYRNELDLGNMIRCSLHVPASYRIWKEGRAEVFSRENLFQNVGIDTRFPQFTYLSFSNQQEFEKFDRGYGELVDLGCGLDSSVKLTSNFGTVPLFMATSGFLALGLLTYCLTPAPVIKEYVIPVYMGAVGLFGIMGIVNSASSKKIRKEQIKHQEELKREQNNIKGELAALPLEKYFGREALEKVLSCDCQVDND